LSACPRFKLQYQKERKKGRKEGRKREREKEREEKRKKEGERKKKKEGKKEKKKKKGREGGREKEKEKESFNDLLILSQAPVAHAYNPSYSGGRDQEDQGSKPDWANSSRDPILEKNPFTKMDW
jgi:hypothetical protein